MDADETETGPVLDADLMASADASRSPAPPSEKIGGAPAQPREVAQEDEPKVRPLRRIPDATYRLQFNRDFTFRDARKIVPYLHDLGISDIYASPYFRARAESTHGYDIANHNQLNPAIGSERDYDDLMRALHARGMGQVLDFVPNHMGIGEPANGWWMDVLENGPASLWADHFDIDWQPLKPALHNKVLLPILGSQYGVVLENGELTLEYRDGAFAVRYWNHWLPMEPVSSRALLRQVVATVTDALGVEDDAALELQSIITGLSHLPGPVPLPRERKRERARETSILKRRLAALVDTQPIVRAALDEMLAHVNGIPEDAASFDRLDDLLGEQAYRLSYWRTAGQEINYRRFFDVNDLAAIRVENEAVFEESHRLLLRLVREGAVTGLRIDHPDGLWDPAGYIRRLQRRAAEEMARDPQADDVVHHLPDRERLARAVRGGGVTPAVAPGHSVSEGRAVDVDGHLSERRSVDASEVNGRGGDPGAPSVVQGSHAITDASGAVDSTPMTLLDTTHAGPDVDRDAARALYVLVEKITTGRERLREDWPVDGTTGYEFANAVTGIFVDRANRRAFDLIYDDFTRDRVDFRELAYQQKKLVLATALAGDLNSLASQLSRITEQTRRFRDFTVNGLTDALREVIACFPVYRSYITGEQPPERQDHAAIDTAIARARRLTPAIDPTIYEFIRSVLLLESPASGRGPDPAARIAWVMKFQQITGPVMAKGLEDTAFYIYNRLVSLNEVGGEPDHFGLSVSAFHRQNGERLARWPHAMLTTSTHDTKRGEDVRARINVLSELPERWSEMLTEVRRVTRPHKAILQDGVAPDRNEEYLLYQTVLGAWPPESMDATAYAIFRDRIAAYMLKAVKEAKVNTSWINPNADYDEAIQRFTQDILGDDDQSQFARVLAPLRQTVVRFGAYNSLAQTLLKLTCPGVPDIYQGNDLWDLSLVDPDNRRPVDYARRARALAAILRAVQSAGEDRESLCTALRDQWQDGRIKLYITHRALTVRRQHAALFRHGAYTPLSAPGDRDDHLCAFARDHQGVRVVVAVGRLLTAITSENAHPVAASTWGDSMVLLPDDPPGTRYRDAFTGAMLTTAATDDGAAVLPLADVFATLPVALLVREIG